MGCLHEETQIYSRLHSPNSGQLCHEQAWDTVGMVRTGTTRIMRSTGTDMARPSGGQCAQPTFRLSHVTNAICALQRLLIHRDSRCQQSAQAALPLQ